MARSLGFSLLSLRDNTVLALPNPASIVEKANRNTYDVIMYDSSENKQTNKQQQKSKNDIVLAVPVSVLRYVFFIRKERFYLTTHSTHFIYGYMASVFYITT